MPAIETIHGKMMWCPPCDKEIRSRVITRLEEYNCKGKVKVQILANVATCPLCGDDLVDEELETENIKLAFSKAGLSHELKGI